MSWHRKGIGSMFCPSLFSSSKMIWVSTGWVMSSPVLASWTVKSSPFLTMSARSSSTYVTLEDLADMVKKGEVFQRHIGTGAGVVEAPVGVFLDDDRLVFRCHPYPPGDTGNLCKRPVTITS